MLLKNEKNIVFRLKEQKELFVKKTAINLSFKPTSVKVSSGEVTVIEAKNGYSVVFDSFDGQMVTLKNNNQQ